MADGSERFVVIKLEGMHCHRCEQAIRKALTAFPGVREVEVDFPSSQASVLYDQGSVTVRELTEAIEEAGYRAADFAHSGTSI